MTTTTQTDDSTVYYVRDVWAVLGGSADGYIDTVEHDQDFLRVEERREDGISCVLHRNGDEFTMSTDEFTAFTDEEYVETLTPEAPLAQLLAIGLEEAWAIVDGRSPYERTDESVRKQRGAEAVSVLNADADALHEMLDEWIATRPDNE